MFINNDDLNLLGNLTLGNCMDIITKWGVWGSASDTEDQG